MNLPTEQEGAEVLLEHFHRLGDAPDAVPRLRRFVLALAVQGKVVARNAAWQTQKIEDCLEPLSDGRLMHQGWSPQCATHPSPNEKVWGVLKTTSIQDGYFLDEQNKELPEQLQPKPLLEVHVGDILLTCAGPRARCGVACLVRKTRKKLMISGKMYRFRPKEGMLSTEFLALFLRSEVAQSAINAMKTGSSESGLNLTHERFRTLAVSFPPLPEQHRIVAKVDELMALCVRLEAAQQEREQRRTRLTAASWQALSTESDPNAAHFALEQLPALTTRPQQIAALRQTILDLAVRGRLVKQDEKDEPAEVLLRRLKVAPALDAPFEIPKSWCWATTGSISDARLGKMLDRAKNTGTMRRYLRNINVRWYDFDMSDVHQMPMKDVELDELRLHSGDVLICEGGYPGRAAVWDERESEVYFQKALHRIRFPEGVHPLYFTHTLKQSDDSGRLAEYFTGVGIKHFTGRGLASYIFPLPPLAEQRRIVAKVDELMRLCDALEAALVRGEEVKGRLLEAVLASGSEDQAPSRKSFGAQGMISRSDDGMRAMPGGQRSAAKVVRGGGEVKAPRVYVEVEPELVMAAEPVAGFAKRGRGRPRKGSAPDVVEAGKAIHGYLRTQAGWHGKAAIVESTGVEASAWNGAIKELMEAGKVERQGEKKGARYRIRS